ncbi:cellulose synthase-like protein E1 [Impatiens glandulifera]|uniref:cellulose synthase-like protein E1 n=1 Tax=Impatiens glandulifera TaxID=253017 RepID=UPI001FB102A6|nr:cellulose synthase-like protein E1 [Impatiens glandulifera]
MLGLIVMFYAMVEATRFSFHWLPYCRKFNVQTRSPAAYFASQPEFDTSGQADHFATIRVSQPNVHFDFDMYEKEMILFCQKLYQEMAEKISRSTKLGKITEDLQQHKGFSKWNSDHSSRHDHDTILQILIDGETRMLRIMKG